MATSPSFSRPAAARGPAVAFESVGKTYGSAVAIGTIDATISPGTFVAIVGSSGSGKSTLLKTVNRLIEPDSGSVRIDGADVAEREPHQLRRSIGYVFQNIGLFPHMTVAQNIGIGSRLASSKPLADDRVAALLDLVDLPRDFAMRLPEQLSGGQKQRVGVARALAGEPGLMLMDEPFGALDPVTREALGEQYRALHERLGLTTIMVTHDMAEALLFADRIWVMAAGRIVADATPSQLIAGGYGAEAEALVAVPRLQAERITAMRAAGGCGVSFGRVLASTSLDFARELGEVCSVVDQGDQSFPSRLSRAKSRDVCAGVSQQDQFTLYKFPSEVEGRVRLTVASKTDDA